MNLKTRIKISPFIILVGIGAYFRFNPISGIVICIIGIAYYLLERKYKAEEIGEQIEKKYGFLGDFIFLGTPLILTIYFSIQHEWIIASIMLYFTSSALISKIIKNRKS
ncbi:hypothetical protein LNTAR_04136 [Lentisphaera araneosa HTCC2155]|jgi:hypothetical protein|uniref:Uncharacterized protein n=1 Tax=Lentisphaera araneosa HTCC2155 TaxID=313628 RepID=A6DTX3_9BACT|nr:hypothetical protein [Lentisphaera araneosa]EDM24889.1 hypothetical protein LNTAR_04136 [Lentisphaera araneosa HTCC2155]